MKTTIHHPTGKEFISFRKTISPALLVLPFLFLTLLISCGTEDPDEPGGIVRQKPAGSIVNTASLTEVTAPAPDCPYEGTGCTIPYLVPIRPPQHHRQVYGELKSYAEMNDLQTFFLKNPDWEIVMPGLKNGSEGYYKLIDGRHKLFFYSDSSIAIYDPAIDADNIIHMYSYNGR